MDLPNLWRPWKWEFWRKPSGVIRAIDTNVVVRYLTGDDPDQAARARVVLQAGEVFACATVLLESECVLRSVYGFGGKDVAVALRKFAGLPNVLVEDAATLAEALDRAADGMDLADALHLDAAAGCEAMLTFDLGFVEKARDAPVRVMEP